MSVKRTISLDLTVLDFTQLRALQTIFQQQEKESYKKEEFCLAVKQTIGPHMTDHEIKVLFAMVNTKLSKTVCWTDFINCIVKAVQERIRWEDLLTTPVLFSTKIRVTRTKYRKPITTIRFIPHLNFESEEIDYSKGRYLMLDRDGLLSVWSINVCPIRYHWIGQDRFHTSMHYTDMVALYPCSMIAVASTTRCITLWELLENGIDRKCDIVDIKSIPTCLDFWAELPSGYPSILLWGDAAGDVYSLSFDVTQKSDMFVKEETQEKLKRVCTDDLMNGRIMNAKLYKTSITRQGWVTKVHFLPNSESFLASCDSVTTPVCVGDLHGGKQRKNFYCHTGVQCFAYSKTLNLLAMGCMDLSVRVWRSFMAKDPIAELRGHVRPVVAVAIRETDEHIISVEKNHAVNVYSLRTQQCVQRLAGGKLLKLGQNPVSSSFYNPVYNQFLMATAVLVRLCPEQQNVDVPEVSSSSQTVVGVVYSPVFERIISVSREGIISTWDLHSGQVIRQLRHVSSRTSEDAEYKSESEKVEVTAFAIDQAKKRIVTGASDGTINLWSICSSVLISKYSLPHPIIVSALAMGKINIYAAGWDRMMYIFNTGGMNNETMRHFWPVHKDDILCMTLMNPRLLVTASSDGDVIIVDRKVGQTVCKLNSCQSRFPFLFASQHPVKRLYFDQSSANAGKASPVALPCTFFDVLKGEYVNRVESDRLFHAYDNSVDAVLFLETRQLNDKKTAVLLTAGGDGWIRAWSLHKQGGLLGQFCATADLGDMVLAMTTDPQNEFLISADTQGYVKVWDLLLYCNASVESAISEESRKERSEMLSEKFVFLKHSFLRDKAGEGNYDAHKRPPPLVSEPESTLKIPWLLNAFRAHACSITCITYVADREVIITGDLGKSVRLWLLSGLYIGTCGELWSGLISPQKTMVRVRKLPRDLRRCASARTFRVVNGGRNGELWKRASLLVHCGSGFQQLALYKHSWRAEDKKKQQLDKEKDLTSADLPATKDQLDPKKSDILGSTFKPNLHFKKRPFIDTSLPFGQSIGFRQLAIHDLDGNIPNRSAKKEMRKLSKFKILSSPRRTGSTLGTPSSFRDTVINACSVARSGGCLSDYSSSITGGRISPLALDDLRNVANRDSSRNAGFFRRGNPAGKDIIAAPDPSHLPPLTTSKNALAASRDVL